MVLFGFVFGLLIGGFMFIVSPKNAPIPFFGLLVTAIALLVFVDWRYEALLQDWGITFKKEKETE